MHILVTGATGFIGRAVTDRLVQEGHRVRALVRPATDQSLLQGLDVETVAGDITDRGSVARAARGVEAVVHAAAWVSLQSGELEEMRRVNVTGVENVASVAYEVGARRLVHVSSIVAVGAHPEGRPVDETFPWPFASTDNPYLLTKHEGELAAFRYARQGLEVVVVNPCMAVGAPDPRGVDPAGIIKFLNRQIPVCLEGGTNYIDVHDVARGIAAALERGRAGERYILGGENLAWLEFYALLEQISGVRAPRTKVPWRLLYGLSIGMDRLEQWTGTPMPINRQLLWLARWKWFADSKKAREELGLTHTPLEQSLRQAVEYYRAQGLAHG